MGRKCSSELLAWAKQYDIEDILQYDGDIAAVLAQLRPLANKGSERT